MQFNVKKVEEKKNLTAKQPEQLSFTWKTNLTVDFQIREIQFSTQSQRFTCYTFTRY